MKGVVMRFLRKSIRAASVLAIFSAVVPMSGAFSAKAQETPAAPASPAPDARGKKPSVYFRDALEKARLGTGLALGVNRQAPALSAEEAEKKSLDTVDHAAEAFGLSTRRFGGVLAIGPQTYTELETDFSKGNAFADMPPTQAFTLLLAGLDARQKAALASAAGLGFNDLTTAAQKHLFAALLPEQETGAWLRGAPEGKGEKSLGVLRDNPASVHLRVAQEVRLECEPTNAEWGSTLDATPADGGNGPKTYLLRSDKNYTHLAKVDGVTIRREVPNVPKQSDLNYGSPRLKVLVPIKDLKTVGDLMSRIAKLTGLEIYAAVGL